LECIKREGNAVKERYMVGLPGGCNFGCDATSRTCWERHLELPRRRGSGRPAPLGGRKTSRRRQY